MAHWVAITTWQGNNYVRAHVLTQCNDTQADVVRYFKRYAEERTVTIDATVHLGTFNHNPVNVQQLQLVTVFQRGGGVTCVYQATMEDLGFIKAHK